MVRAAVAAVAAVAEGPAAVGRLEAEVRAGQAAVTRLTALLTCLLGPVDPGAS